MKRIALVLVALGVLAIGVATVVVRTSGDGADARHSVPFDTTRPPEADGRQLTVFYMAGEDDDGFRAAAQETADVVTVTITARDGCANLSDGEGCSDVGISGPVTVTLNAPLDDRAVVDGSAD